MEIFIIKKEDFNEEDFDFEKKFKNEKRNFEYHLGRYIVKYVLQNFYKLKNIEITDDKKPYVKNSNINFNISHTKNLAAVLFSKDENGLDAEFIKERDFEKLSDYLKIEYKNKIDFYKYWTTFEAKYKSRLKKPILNSFIYENTMFTTASFEKEELKIYKFETRTSHIEINSSEIEFLTPLE